MGDEEKILISGASGFIGGWLAETLCLSGSAKVRAGIRSWSSGARLARFPLEIVLCDVLDKEQIVRAVNGTKRVIHCATGLRDVIVQGTRNMLTVAHQMKISRFVFLSTTEVYGDVSGEIDETTPYQYTGREYGDAKIDAEKLCWKFHEKGLPITVVRPPIVYGPFSKDWTLRLAQRLRSGNWGIFEGYGEGRINLVYVADVVSGILLAARNERAAGQAFQLNGPELATWNHYFQRFNDALGFPPLKEFDPSGSRLRAAIIQPVKSSARFVLNHFEQPLKKLYERFRGARTLMQIAERSIKTTAALSELNLYSRDAVYLNSKAREILAYDPKYNIDAGLQMSVGWLKHLGLVDEPAT
jgi:nucleoside-diphosphate-sugar epimerase